MEDDELDDEEYTSISEQSDEDQSISEGSRERDEVVEDKFATNDMHVYRSQGKWDHTKVDKDEFQLTMWDGTTATIGKWTCFKNKIDPKNGTCLLERPRFVGDCDMGVQHNCMNPTTDNNNQNVSAIVIAHLVRNKVELDPDYEVKLVQEEVKECIHVDVPYHRAWRGMRKAINLVYGVLVSNFDILSSGRLQKTKTIVGEEYVESRKCITPLPTDLWEDFLKKENKSVQHKVKCYTAVNGKFKVKSKSRLGNKGGDEYTVKYEEKNYSCKKWQEYRMPCSHALAMCRKIKDQPINTVDPHFRVVAWQDQFSGHDNFTPVPDKRKWPKASAPDKYDITGCYILMQIWAWERFPRIQLKRKVKDQNYLTPGAPLANRSKCPKSKSNIIAHCVAGIMDQLSSLRDGDTENLSDIYHLLESTLRANPGLGGSFEEKLLKIVNRSFSALTLAPNNMSTQRDSDVLQKKQPKSSGNIVLTQKIVSQPTGGGRRRRQPRIRYRRLIVHPNPSPMQEDDGDHQSDEDYYIEGEEEEGEEEEEEEEEEESPLPRVSSQKKKENGRGSQV
ncbi:OLC1v1036062C1 [Oldenlandia corymbosa var. corymbosa]|uniref:OLC1v1036062C1 n=1 Tax=Oldenlandia corymbosa var. corymbosa TaxID=529605 RepID=A0AAV1CUI9_OLDCO|nr:OLC1v1036062C1 [Oldenlandia corymbosa var. corymbosa]